MRVIVEGVENSAQLALIRKIGGNEIQEYLTVPYQRRSAFTSDVFAKERLSGTAGACGQDL